jgi:mannan endo-1,4-beta-mannosidase
LLGKYWGNDTFVGDPDTSRIDPTINFMPFNAGNVPPAWAPGSAYWAVRWTGQIDLPVDGGVQFRLTHDDGARLYIDGVAIINQWGANTTGLSATQTWVAGEKHSIWVELHNIAGPGSILLEWKYPGQDWQVVPMAHLYSGDGVAPSIPLKPISAIDRQVAYITTINRYPEA